MMRGDFYSYAGKRGLRKLIVGRGAFGVSGLLYTDSRCEPIILVRPGKGE